MKTGDQNPANKKQVLNSLIQSHKPSADEIDLDRLDKVLCKNDQIKFINIESCLR